VTTREQAVQALFDKIATNSYVSHSRRMRDPESVAPANTPVLFLLEHSESFSRPSSSLPPVRALHLRAFIYTDVGNDENAIPASTINNLLDELEANLKADDQGRCTLGGLVQSVTIDGDISKSPGDITGESLAIVPIRILLP
jgi:hypothetical protein